jgi:hypothetical protein
MRVTNAILLGCSLLLPVDTENSVQTLKASTELEPVKVDAMSWKIGRVGWHCKKHLKATATTTATTTTTTTTVTAASESTAAATTTTTTATTATAVEDPQLLSEQHGNRISCKECTAHVPVLVIWQKCAVVHRLSPSLSLTIYCYHNAPQQ